MKYKLICMDLDGVIVKHNNFWKQLHEKFDTVKEGQRLTEKYLTSDFNKLVEKVVGGLWKGKDASPYYDPIESIPYSDNVWEIFYFINSCDIISAIISGSSMDICRRVQKDFGVDHIFANEMVIKDGKLTGDFIGHTEIGFARKAKIIKHLCEDFDIKLEEVIFVGDGMNDVDALNIVGWPIVFNPESDELRKLAKKKGWTLVEGDNVTDVAKILQE